MQLNYIQFKKNWLRVINNGNKLINNEHMY